MPARVTPIQLRLCLTGLTKRYDIGKDVDSAFEVLRTQFGLTAGDARVQFQGLRRDPKTPLRECATIVEWLASVAYDDLPVEDRRILALKAFFQPVNNIGLKRHLLVAKVDTMKLGNAYFQADSAYRPGVNSQQVEADNELPSSSAAAAVHVTTAVAEETSLTTSLVKELLAKIRHLSQYLAADQLNRPPTDTPLFVGVVVKEDISWGAVPTVGENG